MWSRHLFDKLFVSEISMLQQLFGENISDRKVEPSLMSDLLSEPGMARRLLNNVLWPLFDPIQFKHNFNSSLDSRYMQGSLLNAITIFHENFVHDVASRASKEDNYDEGSSDEEMLHLQRERRRPRVIQFNPKLSSHKKFVIQTARILCRTRGVEYSYHAMEDSYNCTINSLLQLLHDNNNTLELAKILSGATDRNISGLTNFSQSMCPKQFIDMCAKLTQGNATNCKQTNILPLLKSRALLNFTADSFQKVVLISYLHEMI